MSFYLSSYHDYDSNKTNTSQAFTNVIPTIELNIQQSYECSLNNLHVPKHVYSLTKDDSESYFQYFMGISEFDLDTGLWALATDHAKIKSTQFKYFLDLRSVQVEDFHKRLFSVPLKNNLMVVEDGEIRRGMKLQEDHLIKRFIEHFKDALSIRYCNGN